MESDPTSQPDQDRLATVLPFRKPQIETIGGIVLNLGRMSIEEVEALERQCAKRVEDARTDLTIVSWHLMNRRDEIAPTEPRDPWDLRGGRP